MKRHGMRFSVRGLLIFVFVVSVGLGWIANRARIQREAVAAIERAGGRLSYRSDRNTTGLSHDGPRWLPKWVVDLVGIDYFDDVVGVYLEHCATDAVLGRVGHLSRLERLRLYRPPITDAGLAHLRGLTRIESLCFHDSAITDAGLAHLRGMTNLQEFILDRPSPAITDRGLAHLRGLTHLADLRISGTQVSDAGLMHLKPLSHLTSLRLSRTRITDAGLADLTALTNLQYLSIAETDISNGGVPRLARLTQLRILRIGMTKSPSPVYRS